MSSAPEPDGGVVDFPVVFAITIWAAMVAGATALFMA